ncbi:MAG: hypothetical protein R3F14_13980 [Polyangiaceae bacterium]
MSSKISAADTNSLVQCVTKDGTLRARGERQHGSLDELTTTPSADFRRGQRPPASAEELPPRSTARPPW